jgi:hypothetical protein
MEMSIILERAISMPTARKKEFIRVLFSIFKQPRITAFPNISTSSNLRSDFANPNVNIAYKKPNVNKK